MILFTDSSVNPQLKNGVGGFLLVHDIENSTEQDANQIKTRSFSNVSSTELELRTLIWARGEIKERAKDLLIYTDSQNIVKLCDRRKRLESTNYRNSSGKNLRHSEIYKEFYALKDEFNFEVLKIKGHSPQAKRNKTERIFSLLDRKTRSELRKSGL